MLLPAIKSPQDLKKLPEDRLYALAGEMRDTIIDVVSRNGGHLASNLGVVELTIALHRVFSSPEDSIVWDVGHQCYPHKLLTGRYGQFHSIRTKDGISGFTRMSESPHDFFDAGHSSSSISSALGLLTAWELEGRKDKVVAVIGDGALTGGMAFEALSHAGHLAKNLIVVVNDNQMSISRNTGAISRYLSRLTMDSGYQRFRYLFDKAVDSIPYINRHLGKFIYRIKRALKGLFLTNNLFVDLGFEYAGPLNGHSITQMEETFRRVKKIPRPVVVHVVTRKGKGYFPAENNPSAFHGVGPFNISDGIVEKYDSLGFTEAFSRAVVSMGEREKRLCAITAAMSKGTGLNSFSHNFPERFFDVGIAEEHAVTFAAGLSAGGMIPVTAIYSTFIQRSFDQIVEDVALQGRHVIIALDRAGAVPGDGETHQGIFDIAMLRPVPNLSILSVCSAADLEICLDWAVHGTDGPVVMRWPKLSCPSETESFSGSVVPGRGLWIKSSEALPSVSAGLEGEMEAGESRRSALLVCTGGMYSETLTAARSLLLSGIPADLYVLRFIKPFDEDYFLSVASKYGAVVVIEDGVRIGGIGEHLALLMAGNPGTAAVPVSVLAFPDRFVPNGTRAQILSDVGLDPGSIVSAVRGLL